jgi:hypothetical protein
MTRDFVVSTSDRINFKRCRRRWDLGSKNRQSLVLVGGVQSPALWLGTGFHFALEDYHGYKRFGSAAEAFLAYVACHRRSELPENWKETAELGEAMLNYYTEDWLPQRGELYETLWVDGVPQVEVNVKVPLDIDPPPGFDRVVYSTTYDRVGIDEHGRIVVIDYKTAAKQFDPGRLELDPQVSSYIWSARLVYGDAVEGASWQQHIKAVPDPPEVLKNGSLSKNKQQYTTARMYEKTCIEYYGKVPSEYQEIINHFASLETPDADRFVRREVIYRNEVFAANEEGYIFNEIDDMIDPNLRLYPNPTRDCTWDCDFRSVCLAMNDGSDYEYMLESEYQRWEGEGYQSNQWRKRLKYPEPLEVEAA